ncbi:hypothetical protein ABPG77_005283 [Micractinium sp. CCAP 211/92]
MSALPQQQQQQAEQREDRQRSQPPPSLPPQEQQQWQMPERAGLPVGTPGFVDLADSDDEGHGLSHPSSPQQGQQQQQQQPPAAEATAPLLATTPAGATGAAVSCPICGRAWPPAAGLSNGQLNAELNAHIDECLTLSALA